jgi:hypothetical protein
MNEKEFQKYHKKPTPTIKKALKIASHLFCTTNYKNACNPPCNIHIQSYTLVPEIINQLNQNLFHNPLPKNNPQTNLQELPKPPKQMQILRNYPIITITDIKQSKRKDKLGTIKIFTSYKCKWMQPENQNYTVWMTSDKVFPHNQQNIAEHNLTLLRQFYIIQQYKQYHNIIEKTFLPTTIKRCKIHSRTTPPTTNPNKPK